MKNQFQFLRPARYYSSDSTSITSGQDQNAWTEENTRRLLQAAAPAVEPDAGVLIRVEQSLERFADLQPAYFRQQRLIRSLRLAAVGYVLALLLSACWGFSIRSAIAEHNWYRTAHPATLSYSRVPGQTVQPATNHQSGAIRERLPSS